MDNGYAYYEKYYTSYKPMKENMDEGARSCLKITRAERVIIKVPQTGHNNYI